MPYRFIEGIRLSGVTARSRVKISAIAIAAAILSGVGTHVHAATITVGPSQTIASGIASAAAGDTVVVNASTRNESIVVNKAITVRANGLVTLRPGAYTGISINSSNCAVIGFRLENFERAIQPDTSRSNVTLQDLTIRNAGAGIWVQGDRWTVERVDMEFRCRDGEDYINAFGSNHVFRRLFLWGLHMPEDIGPRSDGTYKHSDLIQCWTAGGTAGIKNTIVEECIFTDFAEGVYFHNETGVQDGINGNIVRNNVFWGTDIDAPAGVNLLSTPVNVTRFTGPSSSPGTIKNNIYRKGTNCVRVDGVPGVLSEGNIIIDSGAAYAVERMTASQINRGTLGNIMWNINYDGGVSGAPDKTNINPQLQNPNAIGPAVLGPDGIPWTADDAWRPMNTAAAAYGPQVTLGGGGTPTNTVTANNDTFSNISEDSGGISLNVLANDTLTSRAVLSVISVTIPNQGGAASIVNNGASLQYSPKANWSGTESFSYTVSDGEGASDTATVTVQVTDVNDPPTAVANTYSVAANSAATTFSVLTNDSFAPDTGETLTISSVTAPNQGGTATINAGTSIRYTPAASFSGTETFSYTISDGRGGSASANVTVTVTAPVNNAPNAVNDSYTVAANASVTTLSVLNNDSDADGDTLTITSRTSPSAGGSANISGGSIVYAPAAGYSGSESFSYTISDGKGGTDSATVSITVTAAPNNVPNAVNDSYTVAEDSGSTSFNVRGNDTDADGDTLTITSRTSPNQGGSASISGGSINYAPKANFSGSESFSYTISDGKGGTDTASVSVTVTPVNDVPNANDDSYSVSTNSSGNALAVLSNDTDADNDTLSITDLGSTSNGGSVSLSGNGLSYSPAANFSGSDTFTYTVSDGNGGTDTATVTVSVASTNKAPVAVNDAFTVNKNSSANSLVPCTNDSDPDPGDSFTITGIGVPNQGGTVSLASPSSVTYSPAANYIGTETFTYTIRDSQGATASAQVTCTVNDTAPTTKPDRYKVRGRKTGQERGVASEKNRLDVLANDISNSGTPLTLAGTIQDAKAIHGLIELDGDDILYTPANDYKGTEVFLYTVRDGLGQTATGEVTVDVVEDLGTDLCDNFPAILVQMAGLYADFDLKGNDIDADGIPDDFMLEAMQLTNCFDKESALGVAVDTAYQINLMMLDSEPNAALLIDYREALAALAAMNTGMQGMLNQTLDVAGLTLTQTYVSVSCDESGMCMPQPVEGSALADGFQLFEEGRGPLEEPFSGYADIDDDGVTNVEEYEHVIAVGGSRTEFANAATDPMLDGTEVTSNASGGGGGGGGCFIATAAYGTPLASQIDVFRNIRDNRMLGNGLGAAFVDTYYRLSPPIARLVADYPIAASIVRIALWPLVIIGKAFMAAPVLVALALLVAITGPVVSLRRRRQTA